MMTMMTNSFFNAIHTDDDTVVKQLIFEIVQQLEILRNTLTNLSLKPKSKGSFTPDALRCGAARYRNATHPV